MTRRLFDEEITLDRATDLFRRSGYAGTSIQDLVEATSVNRASLYGTFGNKEQIFLRALDRYCDRQISTLRIESAKPPVPALSGYQLGLLDQLAEWGRPGGCLLTSACAEFGALPESIQHRAKRALGDLGNQVRDYLTLAQSRGELPAGADLAGMSRFFVGTRQSICLLWCAGNSRGELEQIVELSLSILDASRACIHGDAGHLAAGA
jgi:TetR/AcrR family transcriptional repressor of nem operon